MLLHSEIYKEKIENFPPITKLFNLLLKNFFDKETS